MKPEVTVQPGFPLALKMYAPTSIVLVRGVPLKSSAAMYVGSPAPTKADPTIGKASCPGPVQATLVKSATRLPLESNVAAGNPGIV